LCPNLVGLDRGYAKIFNDINDGLVHNRVNSDCFLQLIIYPKWPVKTGGHFPSDGTIIWPGQRPKDGSMTDILDELKAWRQQLRATPSSEGIVPGVEIARLGRAISEIENLRAELKGQRETYKS
jgi:hypothetical protein